MSRYHNIERRNARPTLRADAKYRGWDASGRFWFVGQGGKRGALWWADIRDTEAGMPTSRIYGKTLRAISEKLASISRDHFPSSATN